MVICQREALATGVFPERDICRRPALRRTQVFPSGKSPFWAARRGDGAPKRWCCPNSDTRDLKLGRNDSLAGSLDSCAWRCRAQGLPIGTYAPSVGGSVRRPHAPPRWGRFLDTRYGELGQSFGPPLRRPYFFILSAIQVLFPHWHSNMWNVRPVGGSSMLVMNWGCSPHFKQRGAAGLGRSCFSVSVKFRA